MDAVFSSDLSERLDFWVHYTFSQVVVRDGAAHLLAPEPKTLLHSKSNRFLRVSLKSLCKKEWPKVVGWELLLK